jgi:hypothetical protein
MVEASAWTSSLAETSLIYYIIEYLKRSLFVCCPVVPVYIAFAKR